MATLKNSTISDSGYVTVPSGTTAQRPSTPVVTLSTNRPLAISANNLRLYIPGYWSIYQNLPAYLTGLITTTHINVTDNGTFTVSHACRVYMLRNTGWNAVDITGWTLNESDTTYIAAATTNVYYRDFSAGTYTLDDNSAMYMFDFGTNASARKGMIRFNTDSQILEHYDGLFWRNDIVRSGLVLHLDFGNAESYGWMGDTVRDISGHGRHLTLTGSPTWSPANYGIMQFNGSNQFGQTIDLNLASGTSTVIAGARYSGATRGRIISGVSNNWLLGWWSNSTENYFAEGWVTAVGAGTSDTNWRVQAATGNTATDSWANYVNGVLASSNNGGSQGINNLNIGSQNGTAEFSTCEVSFVLAYDRVLSAAEIFQNFNAHRYRFGI